MSSWWVYRADAHLRVLCDGETGPMFMCSPEEHYEVAPFPTVPYPDGWFDNDPQPDSITPDGYGPDFRPQAMKDTVAEG